MVRRVCIRHEDNRQEWQCPGQEEHEVSDQRTGGMQKDQQELQQPQGVWGSLRTPLKRLQPKLVQHRHADVMGGYVKQCQLYPKSCCQAVCAGTEAPKKIHDLGMRSVLVTRVKEMIAAYVKSGVSTEENSPSKALHEDDSDCDDLSTCMAWVGTKASSRRTMYLAPS